MLKGEAYHSSSQKRALDVAVATSFIIPERIVALLHSGAAGSDNEAVYFDQQRIGQGEHEFEIVKFRTLDDYGGLLSRGAGIMRRYGVDELP